MIDFRPSVSIMIPTYNRVERLRRAIESALNQDYPPIEILISDNASNDGTESYLQLLADPKVKSFRQETNIGLIGNWNFLANKANGDYCLMLSDDDELDRHGIKNLVAALEAGVAKSHDLDIRLIVGNSNISNNVNELAGGSITAITCRELLQRVLRSEIQALPSATLIRTDSVKQNGYRDYYGTAIDLGLVADLAKNNSHTVITNEIVCKYNIHSDNITSKFDIDEIYKTYRRLLRVAYRSEGTVASYLMPRNIFMRKVLGYVVTERYSNNKITLLSAFTYLRKYRKYFEPIDYFSIPFKMFVKKLHRKIG
jgi:glycosyltransferase involved in cell wall biosynthesis